MAFSTINNAVYYQMSKISVIMNTLFSTSSYLFMMVKWLYGYMAKITVNQPYNHKAI